MKRRRRFVLAMSLGAGALGALLSPVPLLDEALLLPALLGMGAVVGKQSGQSLHELPWRAMARSAAVGISARAAVNLPVAYVPGVAAAANATTAFAITNLYASWVEAACADPRAARPLTFSDTARFFREFTRRRGNARPTPPGDDLGTPGDAGRATSRGWRAQLATRSRE